MVEPATSIDRKSMAFSKSSGQIPTNSAAVIMCCFVDSVIWDPLSLLSNTTLPKCRTAARFW